MTKLLQSAVRNFGAKAVSVAALFGGMAAMSCDKELKMAKKSQAFVKEQEKTTKNSVLPQMSNSAKAKIAAGVVGVATLFGACNNDASPTPILKECICPANTAHEPNAKCCDGINCVCIEKKYYNNNGNLKVGSTPVTIEDRTDTVTSAHVTLIQNALASIYATDPTGTGDITSHGNITIVVENASSYASGNGVRVINSTSFAIRSAWLLETIDPSTIGLIISRGLDGMNEYYYENEYAVKKIDNAKQIIRLAKGTQECLSPNSATA